MNASSVFNFYSQVYFKSLIWFIKNFYFSFLKPVRFGNVHCPGALREKWLEKHFPIFIYYHPFLSFPLFSLHFSFGLYFHFFEGSDQYA